jgi:hypothetical protein
MPGLPYLNEFRDRILIPNGIVTNRRSSSYYARSCYRFSISWLILFSWAGPPEDRERCFSRSRISSTSFDWYYLSTITLLGGC